MPNINLVSISPGQLEGNDHSGPYDVGRFARKFLAQGDSWFSIGHLPPWSTTNLLQQMTLSRSAVAVNCARPGAELAHMTDSSTAKQFLKLLRGKFALQWDAILVSGGGNDLIDALNSDPTAPAAVRLLLRQDEWGANAGGDRYVSEAGWSTFANHLEEVLLHLLSQRDQGINANVPLVLHTYDYLTPRDAPAGPGMGPWLFAALKRKYKIPEQDWTTIADLFIDRLAALWIALCLKHAAKNLVVVDSRRATTRAAAGSAGVSFDWENEIHPTPDGYAKLAGKWRGPLDAI